MADSAAYKFTVKESADGEPWIAAEPMQGEIAALRGSNLAFDLRPGASIEDASRVASLMNSAVSAIRLWRA